MRIGHFLWRLYVGWLLGLNPDALEPTDILFCQRCYGVDVLRGTHLCFGPPPGEGD